MYLFTEYVLRESVDSAHNSRISSTFQEADCLQKLVKVNKQVFAITLLSRNLNHTAQLSISARGEIIILSVGLGGKKRKRPHISPNEDDLEAHILPETTGLKELGEALQANPPKNGKSLSSLAIQQHAELKLSFKNGTH